MTCPRCKSRLKHTMEQGYRVNRCHCGYWSSSYIMGIYDDPLTRALQASYVSPTTGSLGGDRTASGMLTGRKR